MQVKCLVVGTLFLKQLICFNSGFPLEISFGNNFHYGTQNQDLEINSNPGSFVLIIKNTYEIITVLYAGKDV